MKLQPQDMAAYVEKQLHALAKVDVNAFATAVMRDEGTGRALAQAPVHRSWHKLAEEYNRLLVWCAVEHGKTTQLSILRTLWLLGRNPSLRIGIVSNTSGQAAKVMDAIRRYIEVSQELHDIFPELRPSGDNWTTRSITVQRPYIAKDPSIQTMGVHGNVLGSRLDYVIIDDLLDVENTRTQASRQDVFHWLQASVLSRLTAQARVMVVGTAFHPEDALHKLAALPGWKALRFPAVNNDGTPRWPERWPMERLEAKRLELGPLEYARQLLCIARSDEEARFKREWIDACLARGAGKSLAYGLAQLPQGVKTYTGVDLAVQQKDSADKTCLFTIAVWPNGDREVLNVESGRWAGAEIVSRIIDTHRRFMSVCVVENNAAQDFLLQWARGQWAVPIYPFTTGRNKAHPEFGVESIAAEMAGSKWIIPSINGHPAHPELVEWVQQMLFYSPANHTGDTLMASWFAREGWRLHQSKPTTARLNITAR